MAAPVPWEATLPAQPPPQPGWAVPEGTRAGQVFLVDGQYYVAVPRQPARRLLPPIPSAHSRLAP